MVIVCCAAIGLSYSALYAQEDSPASRSVWDGVYTKAQADRGRPLYSQDCASCHGPSLEGNGEAPALAGLQFLSDWNGLTVGDLFTRIRKTMPQDHPGRLTREVYADILAYILSANNFPDGKTELSYHPEVLAEIQIQSTKPDAKKDTKKGK